MSPTALPELDELERILETGGSRLEVRTACEVAGPDGALPVPVVCLGNPSPDVPAVAFVGGVHGLERIGSQVVLSFLGSLVARLHSDELLHRQLEHLRLVFMPMVNPAGMSRRTRANGNGVDLMRNAPVDSRERVAILLGGHRLGPRLPWYRGASGNGMEAESLALCELVRSELLPRPFSLALDCHSGFGMRDRIWFPHAHTREPFERAAEVHALKRLFDTTYPHHAYVFEPQSRQYLTHGDLWDYLSLDPAGGGRLFLPLTLEMGSWRWIRKSPRQILSRLGIFNPIPADRRTRVRRNHLLWMGFLCRAAHTWREWVPVDDERARHAISCDRHLVPRPVSRSWILLRGWSREARHWGGFVEQFAATFPEDRVRVLDLPGAGELNGDRSPASIAALAQHCHARAGSSGPVYLLGLSLGAMVCAAWSLAQPGTVAGLVMVSASLRPFSPPHHRLRPRSYGALARAMLETDLRAREERILRLTSTRPGAHPGVVDTWARYAADRRPAPANVARQLWAAASFRAPQPGPDSPLLVLAGGGDILVDPRCSQAIARAWGGQLAVHPTAGHDLPLDDGAWVAAQVSGWVRPT